MEEVKNEQPTPEELERDALMTKAIECAEKTHKDGHFNKSHWGDYWADDGSCFEVVDSAGQHLFFRVGMVFTDGSNKPDRTPGVWIDFQEHYMHSPITGCLLLSPETFEAITKYYRRCKRHDTWWYGMYWRMKCWLWDVRDWLKDRLKRNQDDRPTV